MRKHKCSAGLLCTIPVSGELGSLKCVTCTMLTHYSSHAKWWLTLKRRKDINVGDVMDTMIAAIEAQYTVLDQRLDLPGQQFIALPDRVSLADFATLPFANEQVAAVAGIEFEKYAKLHEWSRRMFDIEGVSRAFARVKTFGLN
jgi:hypothetical protein